MSQTTKTYELASGRLTRVDIDDEHYYFIDDEYCLSVTRVLDIGAPFPEGLRNWLRNTDGKESQDYMMMTRDRGSKLHSALEELLKGFSVKAEDYPTLYEKDALTSFIRVMRFLQPTDIETELVVADKGMRLGGTMDMVCTVDERLIGMLLDPNKYLFLDGDDIRPKVPIDRANGMIPLRLVWDHKFTGRSTYNHEVQVSKYLDMYTQSYPERPQPTRAFTWRYSPKHKFKFELCESKLTPASFNRIYDTALEYMGGFPKPPLMTIYPNEFRLFKENT